MADPVQAADALFQQGRIQGQIEQDQAVGELEVAALAADFGTDQQARAVIFREPGGAAVPLHQGEAFVKDCHLDLQVLLQGGLDRLGLASAAADQQQLVGIAAVQQVHQPQDPGILGQVALEGRDIGQVALEFPGQGLLAFAVWRGAFQRHQPRVAAGKALDPGSGVAEHDPAGAVVIQQVAQQQPAGRRIPQARRERGRVQGQELGQPGLVLGRQRLLAKQLLGHLGHGAESFGLAAVGLEIVKAIRIQQAQPGKMAGDAQLLGGGGEQQQARAAHGQPLHGSVFGADAVFAPAQVMGLVHHQHVPAGRQGLLQPPLVGEQG